MLPCDNILDVSNAKRSPIDDSVTCGTKVRYTCNEGFVLDGDSVLQCGTDGKLKGHAPICKKPGNYDCAFWIISSFDGLT